MKAGFQIGLKLWVSLTAEMHENKVLAKTMQPSRSKGEVVDIEVAGVVGKLRHKECLI